MRNCWKCGKPIISGSECDSCAEGTALNAMNPVPNRGPAFDGVPIDWEKVKTFEDMLEILKVLKLAVRRNSVDYHRLKKFLKE